MNKFQTCNSIMKDIGGGGEEGGGGWNRREGVSGSIYGSKGAQVYFTQNFRFPTPLLKILEFSHTDLNFKFSTFSENNNPRNLIFLQ